LYRKHSEKRKQEGYEDTDADVVLQTAVEAEDLWEEELHAFKPASRTTGCQHFAGSDFGLQTCSLNMGSKKT